MLQSWEKQHPGRLDTMFRAMQNVAPSQLGDTELFDFKNLEQKQLKMMAQRIDIVDAG